MWFAVCANPTIHEVTVHEDTFQVQHCIGLNFLFVAAGPLYAYVYRQFAAS